MTHPLELNAAQAVHGLRLDHTPDHQQDGLTLAEGIYFSWDAKGGDVALDVQQELGQLFHATARVGRSPSWFSFNLSLREGTLAPGDMLGLVVDFEGCAGESLPMFIRTARGEAVEDTYLQETLQGSPHRRVQTLLHKVRAADTFSGPQGFHTLVLNLPKRNFTLSLRDMKLFVVPAERHLALGKPTLAAG